MGDAHLQWMSALLDAHFSLKAIKYCRISAEYEQSAGFAWSPQQLLFLIYKLYFSYLAASISSISMTRWILPCRRVRSYSHSQTIKQT